MFGAAAEKSEVTILPKASHGELREIHCELLHRVAMRGGAVDHLRFKVQILP